MQNQDSLNGFLQMFNFSVNNSSRANRIADKLIPTRNLKDKKGIIHQVRDKMSPTARNVFDYWEANMYSGRDDYKNRQHLFEDMDLMYFNSAIIGKAIKMLADEAIQADINNIPIGVEANRKTRKYILDLFDRTGLHYKLPSTAEDIAQYGNAGWMLGFDHKGVNEIIPIDVYDIIDRLEFNANQVQKQMNMYNSPLYMLQTQQRVKALINSISHAEVFSADYKTYLFGFQIGNQLVPPWRFMHFRNYTSKNPFSPFGMPFYINSVAPYRQYDAGLTLQVAARGARFPVDLYSLSLPTELNHTTQLEMALEFIQQHQNSGLRGVQKEGIGIGEIIYSIKELFEYSQITPQIDIGKIDDLDLLKEDLIESTDIPANFFIAGKDGFGSSGMSLVQQYKPFARRVFRLQSIMMAEISQMIKISMIQSGDFSEKDLDFMLTMPYPESQTSPDIISSQKDLLDLANGVLSSLADSMFGGSISELPIEVIRQVYSKILPQDQSTIDNWINTIVSEREKDSKQMKKDISDAKEIDNTLDFGSLQKAHGYAMRKQAEGWKRFKEMKHTDFKEKVDAELLKYKQETWREGAISGKHYYSSNNRNTSFMAETLIKLDKERINILKEGKEKEISPSDLNKQLEDYRNETVKVEKYVYTTSKEEVIEKIKEQNDKKWSTIREVVKKYQYTGNDDDNE